MLGHRKIVRILTFKGKLIARSPIYVGSGGGLQPGVTDLTFIKMRDVQGREIPYIPGSSIKGVLRSVSESIASEAGLHVCDVNVKNKRCSDKYVKGEREPIKLSKRIDNLRKNGQYDKVLRLLRDELCVACKVYGSQIYRSPIEVSNSTAINYSYGYKPGIAISRKTGAVRHGPFFVEYVAPGSEFEFRMDAKNLPNYLIGLVAAAILEVNKGWALIGGQKTRGFGKVEILLKKIGIKPVQDYESGVLKPLFGLKEDSYVELPKIKVDSEREEDLREFTNAVLSGFVKAWRRYVTQQTA